MAGKRSWRITSQVHDQVINTAAGQTVTGTYVYFLTGNGNEASVFVPDTVYTTEHIRRLVDEKAKLVDDVGELAVGQ